MQSLFSKVQSIVAAVLVISCTAALAAPASKKGVAHHPNSSKTRRSALTEEDALKLITERPEVKSWQRNVTSAAAKKRGSTPHIAVDRDEDGAYVVHVYEEVPDDDQSGHTATFNWYHVNKQTGKVTKEL